MRHETKILDGHLAGISDLTVVAPLRRGFVPSLDAVTYKTRAKRVLRLLHAGRQNGHEFDLVRLLVDAVERVGRIHSVRIAVLEPQDVVLLAATFDGAWESYVRVIWQKVARLLDLVFCNTEGYVRGWTHSYDDWGRWLRSRQAETPFLYATPGFSTHDLRYLRMHERLAELHDGAAAARQDARIRIPETEDLATAWFEQGRDLLCWPSRTPKQNAQAEIHPPLFRQGVRSLAGLYRLADVYPPGTEDGEILLEAARELLPDFRRLLPGGDTTLNSAVDNAKRRFDEPMRWLETPRDLPPARVPLALPAERQLTSADDIQAGILDPYPGLDHAAMLLLGFRSPAALAHFLRACRPTSLTAKPPVAKSLVCNLALSLEGLRLAGLTDEEVALLPSEFVQGMERRADLLGDLRGNHPRRWRLPLRNCVEGLPLTDAEANAATERVPLNAVHAIVQLRRIPPEGPAAADAQAAARQQIAADLQALIDADAGGGIVPLSLQWLARLRSPEAHGKVIDHFHYQDAESSPVLERANAGQFYANQVHPGEALLGYPNAADPAPSMAPQASPALRSLLHNGSFLVVRKLRMDKPLLDAIVDRAVADNRASGIDKATVLAKMMGRYPDGPSNSLAGQPLATVLGHHEHANDFTYAPDPDGARCPLHSHIRRSNPRPLLTEPGERPARIFRRGIAYGPLDGGPEHERGLMFMAYNASIGEQFEQVQRWVAGGNSAGNHALPGDPFLGVPEPGRLRCLRFAHDHHTVRVQLDGDDDPTAEPQPLVRLEWGGYYFAPSLKALRLLAERASGLGMQPPSLVPRWSAQRGEQEIARLQRLAECAGPDAAKQAWKEVLEDADAVADFRSASVWAAIRQRPAGALRTPYGVLVADKALVERVLCAPPQDLSATGYLPRMHKSIGEIYLGRDAGDRYTDESRACNQAISERNPADIRAKAAEVTTEKLGDLAKAARQEAGAEEVLRRAAGATARTQVPWELSLQIKELIDWLLGHFCEEWFGLQEGGEHFHRAGLELTWKPGDKPRYPGHFMAASRYIFQPHPAPQVEDTAAAHGAAMRKAMTAFLRAKRPRITAPIALAVLQSLPASPSTKQFDLAARTLVGALMGMVPTVDANLRSVLHQWLQEGTLWSLRAQRGKAGAPRTPDPVQQAFLDAMQARPLPEVVWRTAQRAHALGKGGTAPAVELHKGDIVVAGLASATQQGLEPRCPARGVAAAFGHTESAQGGKPLHACPGYAQAMAMMLGFVDALVASEQPMRPGPGTLTLQLDGVLAMPLSPPPTPAPPPTTAKPARTKGPDSVPDEGPRALTPLFAFGDSWLASLAPLPDLPSQLPAQGYEITRSDALRGRTLEEMARRAHAVAASLPGMPCKAILLCGGGNDLVWQRSGPQDTMLYRLLDPKATAGVRARDLKTFIAELGGHFRKILDLLLTATNGDPVPILVHGYGDPVPDGRPAKPSHPFELGPWLEPVFGARGMVDPARNTTVMGHLVTELNTMLKQLARDYARTGLVHHVDLRAVLGQAQHNNPQPPPAMVYTDWADELHPSTTGYAKVAATLAERLGALKVAPWQPPTAP